MQYPRHKILFLAVAAEGLALIVAVILAMFYGIKLTPVTENPLRDVLIGTAGALVPFTLFLLTLSEKSREVPFVGPLQKTLRTDVKSIFLKSESADLFVIALLAGVAEEMLFRGVLQVKFGIITASILFGLVHCVSFQYVMITALMGFYIGLLFQWSGSLLVPIHLHFVYDLGALLYLRYFVPADH